MTDSLFYYSWMAFWLVGFTAATHMRGFIGLCVNEEKSHPFHLTIPAITILLAFIVYILAAAIAFPNYDMITYSMTLPFPDFDHYVTFAIWSYTNSLVFYLLVNGHQMLQRDLVPIIIPGYFITCASANIFLSSTLIGYDVVTWLANTFFILFWPIRALIVYYRNKNALQTRKPIEEGGLESLRGEKEMTVFGLPGQILRVRQLDRPVVLAWSSLMAETGLRFFVDGPRTSGYIVLVVLLPVLFALASCGNLWEWIHFSITISAAFWTAFWFFPILSDPPAFTALNNGQWFIVNVWPTSLFLEMSQYFYAPVALAFVLGMYADEFVLRSCFIKSHRI